MIEGSTAQTLLFVAAVPAVTAMAIACLSRRWLPEALGDRYSSAVAFAVAFCAGYLLLRDLGDLVPTRHWHWLPYLSLAAAVIGPVSVASGLSKVESGLLCLLLAIVGAWLLVPTWASLQPPRPVLMAVMAGYLFLFTALLIPLALRLPPPLLLTGLLFTSMAVAVMIAACVSVTYGVLAGAAASAVGGCLMASWFKGARMETAALVPAFALVVVGLALVGSVEPKEPLFGILLAPTALLAPWASKLGPLARLDGAGAAAVQLGLVLAPLGCVTAWVFWATS